MKEVKWGGVVQLWWSNGVPELVTTVTKLALAVLIMLRFKFDVKIFYHD